MSKIILSFFLIWIITPLHTNPILLLEEDFETCSQNVFRAISGNNNFNTTSHWNCSSAGNNDFIQIQGAASSDGDWLVSPPIDMDSYEDEKFSFWYKNELQGLDIQLFYSNDFNGETTASAIAAATWTNIPLDLYDIAKNRFIEKFLPYPAIDISDISGTAVYFAFYYTSTTEEAEIWQLDNIRISANYYSEIENQIDNGLSCVDLKTTLAQQLRHHEKIFYTSSSFDIWDAFYATDRRLNDAGVDTIVWDIYSDNPTGEEPYTYDFGEHQDTGIGGGTEGEFYNREHVLPRSWWGGGSSAADTQYVDLHHIFPADKAVNQMKSNYPLGVTNNPVETSMNGSQIGNNTIGDYMGSIFEPIEEYKGDFARAYLYMATRYQHLMPLWETQNNRGDDALNGNTYTVFEDWLVEVLLSWHENDPVSERELHRNNAIYTIQKNRNPYIDHPEYVAMIWGGSDGSPCSAIALPLKSLDFQIQLEDEEVILSWQNLLTPNEYYEIELSYDNQSFRKIGEAASISSHLNIFDSIKFKHHPSKTGQHYYRLCWKDEFDTKQYSELKTISIPNVFFKPIKTYFLNGQLWFRTSEKSKFWNVLGQ